MAYCECSVKSIVFLPDFTSAVSVLAVLFLADRSSELAGIGLPPLRLCVFFSHFGF